MKFEGINGEFYPVTHDEIEEAEHEMKIKIPNELKAFYMTIGYGFIGNSNNINRIMDPLSVRDFRLRKNDFEFYPDIEVYKEFEKDKLVFFEASETVLISIQITEQNKSQIFYYDILIANSFEEFLQKINKNDDYYLDMI